MFCKFCGKPIDEGTMRCRVCGRPVGPLEGGNGFWDLAGEQTLPTEGAPAEAKDEALEALQKQVEELKKQLEERPEPKSAPAQKRGALPVVAALLALLALAVGCFALVQLRQLSVREEKTWDSLCRVADRVEEIAELLAPETAAPAETAEPGSIQFVSNPNLFDGPRKGNNDTDPRGQSIRLGMPAEGEETPIFSSKYVGPPGTYRYYWAKVETDEETRTEVYRPLEEEEGYRFQVPSPSVGDQTYTLFIVGEVLEEQMGRYAFVAEDTQTNFAYVSTVVELYPRQD